MTTDPPDEPIRRARAIYGLRRERGKALALDPDLFGKPAWDLLLDLYIATARGRPVSVSEVSPAASVPASTALRWIARLERAGAVERTPDTRDRRRMFLTLSEPTRAALERWLSQARVA